MENKLCKLCFNSNKEIINIFDENGVKLNIAHILRKHFWFKVVIVKIITLMIIMIIDLILCLYRLLFLFKF